MAFALSHLSGRAKEWSYSKLMLDRNAFPTWPSFCEQLRTTFEPPDQQLKLRARLLSCKQGKRSLHEFVQEMQYLRAAITSDRIPETILVTAFLEGIRPGPARLQLYREVPKTLDDAIRIAHMEEYSHRSANHTPRGGGPTPMEVNGFQRQRTNGNIRCYNCNRAGHLARDCRQPKRNNGSGKGFFKKKPKTPSKGSTGKGPNVPAKGTTFAPPRSGNGNPQ